MSHDVERVTELGPGLFQIASPFDGRRLHQHLVVDGDEALLIDAGTAETPDAVILPALEQIGVPLDKLACLLVTHPDVDHQGGASRVRALAPQSQVACGFLDVPLVEDPDIMLRYRYRAYAREHALDFDAESLPGIRRNCGDPIEVDRALAGGERIAVGSRELVIHHVPGHAAGHLAVEDAQSGDLFMADAVHGRGSPGIDGSRALPPTYEEVDSYLATIEKIRALSPQRLHSGHMPPLEGIAVSNFLNDSEAFVAELDALLLAAAAEPATLAELCACANDEFGPFAAGSFYFMFTVHGHLRRLVASGHMRVVPAAEPPLRFVWA